MKKPDMQAQRRALVRLGLSVGMGLKAQGLAWRAIEALSLNDAALDHVLAFIRQPDAETVEGFHRLLAELAVISAAAETQG